jgi:hypothetical protein
VPKPPKKIINAHNFAGKGSVGTSSSEKDVNSDTSAQTTRSKIIPARIKKPLIRIPNQAVSRVIAPLLLQRVDHYRPDHLSSCNIKAGILPT